MRTNIRTSTLASDLDWLDNLCDTVRARLARDFATARLETVKHAIEQANVVVGCLAAARTITGSAGVSRTNANNNWRG